MAVVKGQHKKRRVRVKAKRLTGLSLVAFIIGLLCLSSHPLFAAAVSPEKGGAKAKKQVASPARDPFKKPGLFDDIENSRDPSFNPKRVENGRFVSRFKSGVKTAYTIRPDLQSAMEKFLEKNRVPYGVFIAINPNNGKILAMAEHSSREPHAKNLALRATYPAASIFKLITASAAIEERGVRPNTLIVNFNRFNPIQTTLEKAFAASDNEAFGEIALHYLNMATLIKYATRFQFNHQIPFELPVQVSRMKIKEAKSKATLARLAAGFENVGLSPLHAALIGSAIANDGKMVAPCLVDHVLSPSGQKLFECPSRVFAKPISSSTAAQLRQMMGRTVKSGTARRAFWSTRRDPVLRSITMGGKTGSLTGKNPTGKVTWFVGMAPLDNPEVVISAVVVNHMTKPWTVRASNVAKEGFQAYFKSKPHSQLAKK
jgi:cell division protein FtsI/penicillin-binding protein 2